MLIRTEAPADILPIEQLVTDYGDSDELPRAIRKLRQTGQMTLSLVACDDDGMIQGHLLFTELALESTQSVQWLCALTLSPSFQRDGSLKEALIEYGLETLSELSYSTCVTHQGAWWAYKSTADKIAVDKADLDASHWAWLSLAPSSTSCPNNPSFLFSPEQKQLFV
ncbi:MULTISPECIES: GNAT family N-acetyltransferase [unclassified Vibrio]|uniref:GNAT family N-acetyltransferase n=1 Tax=Vibrio sp. HB236076 TaxID=3232307 RepID=A0AB39HDN4_9VIBR|nr:hypothetical protein [Vibrio sp. HB161653]MDP5254057.1 hypothetical protein [Vibrio sp. HB161653]